jgi:hypothetical protein
MISTEENRSYSTFDEDDDESSIVMYNHSKLYLSSGNHSHNSHSHQSWDKMFVHMAVNVMVLVTVKTMVRVKEVPSKYQVSIGR